MAGAVVYAEDMVKRVEDDLREKLDTVPHSQIGRKRLVDAMAVTQEAANAARQATVDAKSSAAAFRSLNTDPSTARPCTADLNFWKEAHKLQWAAFKSARELKLILREYTTECSPGKRQWVDIGFNFLRRAKATKWLFPQDPKAHDLGKECSYFAVMGGYTFCPLKEEHNPDHEYTLNPDALAFLLREECITTVQLAKLRKVVVDKGKSDVMAKLLVCIQGIWMGVNCLSRKIAGLPLTLLELNVVMHVVCAVAVYVCWWKKPHDAGLPISLSRFFPRTEAWALIYTADKYGPRLCCSLEEPKPDETSNSQDPTSSGSDKIASLSVKPPATTSAAQSAYRDMKRDELDEKEMTVDEKPDDVPPAEVIHHEPRHGYTLRLLAGTVLDNQERDICAAAVKEIRRIYKQGSTLVSVGKGQYPLSTPRINMTPLGSGLRTGRNLLWVLIPLCLMYGGAHASAWNRHFPTETERLLWRISCIIVGAPGPGAAAVWFFEFLFSRREDIGKKIWHHFEKAMKQMAVTVACILGLAVAVGAAGGSIYGIVLLLSRPMTRKRKYLIIALSIETTIVVLALCGCVIFALAVLIGTLKWKRFLFILGVPIVAVYCAARAFIVLESFISVRSLPLGAYRTVSWENAWPHI